MFNMKLLLFLGICLLPCAAMKPSVTTVCEDDTLSMKCASNHVVVVSSALYGRTDNETCSKEGEMLNQTCVSPTSVHHVKKLCHRRQSCMVPASNSVFGDPCEGTHKYLQVVHHCSKKDSPKITKTACEESNMDIRCGPEERIHISTAFFGRKDSSICPKGNTKDRNCKSRYALFTVRQWCQGLQSCPMPVLSSPYVFGDPCVGTSKYLQVTYRCL